MAENLLILNVAFYLDIGCYVQIKCHIPCVFLDKSFSKVLIESDSFDSFFFFFVMQVFEVTPLP